MGDVRVATLMGGCGRGLEGDSAGRGRAAARLGGDLRGAVRGCSHGVQCCLPDPRIAFSSTCDHRPLAAMKNECMLSLNRQQVQQVGDYCASHSTSLPACIVEHARTTAQQTEREGEMATSFAQCSWMMGIIKTIKPRRSESPNSHGFLKASLLIITYPVLEVGTFTGLSSLAFYEATRDTGAEIITVDVCDEFIQIALTAFEKYGVTDRVKQVKGSFPDV